MDRVVLLHGLGRTWRSMRPLARALDRAGFRTFTIGYPSVLGRVPDLAAIVQMRMTAAFRDATAASAASPRSTTSGVPVSPEAPPRLHFVGHSLGCILIRFIIAHDPPPGLGRIVMLTPPNQGARMADRTEPLLGWMVRPLRDLKFGGGMAASIPTPPGVEIGVITGRHDRTVRVEETHVPGETGRASVGAGHSFIMLNREAQELTVRFLTSGSFATPGA
jgi:alpha-beta hydrolase superfamily lysophospholipase